MFRRRGLLGFLTLLAVVVAGFPGAAFAAPAGTKQMVERINATRAARGLPALRYSPSLTRSSRRYGRRLMRSDRFGHASRIQASSAFHRLGEVLSIHGGWRSRVGGTVRGWMRSSGHRHLVMSRAMRQVGAGRVRGRFGGRLMTIWVVQLGRR